MTLDSQTDSGLADNEQASHFLKLPIELRTKILEAVLYQPRPISYRGYDFLDDCDPRVSKWMSGCPDLAITSTCRQLHREGTHIFFTSNTFDLTIHVHDGTCSYDEDLESLDFVGFESMNEAFKHCPNFRRITRLNIAIAIVCFSTTREVLQQEPLCKDSHLLRMVPKVLKDHLGRLQKIVVEFLRYETDCELDKSDANLIMQNFRLLRADRVDFVEFSAEAAEELKAIMEGS